VPAEQKFFQQGDLSFQPESNPTPYSVTYTPEKPLFLIPK
jgi:hypothetical protein